jgi:hypothetical protein
MHGALASQQLGPGLIDEPNSNGVDTYLGAASAHAEDQMGPGMYRREPTHPHMLEDAKDRELTLLVD